MKAILPMLLVLVAVIFLTNQTVKPTPKPVTPQAEATSSVSFALPPSTWVGTPPEHKLIVAAATPVEKAATTTVTPTIVYVPVPISTPEPAPVPQPVTIVHMYDNQVTVEPGTVKGCKYPDVAEQQGYTACDSAYGDAPMAYVTVADPYTKVQVTYYPTASPEHKKTTGGLFNGNKTAMIGALSPATEYTWVVEVTSGEETVSKTGTFKTADYPVEPPAEPQ